MEEAKLLQYLGAGETDQVEFKEGFSRDPLCKTICAYANDLPNHESPGRLFVGVQDDGTPVPKFKVTDTLLKKLADLRNNGNIHPFPEMVVQPESTGKNEMVVVLVKPAKELPLRFYGQVYVRVGPTTRKATQAEERTLAEKRRHHDPHDDLQPLYIATVKDLSQARIDEYLCTRIDKKTLQENSRPREMQLVSCQLLSFKEPHHPTVTGMIVCGQAPCNYLPGAYIQFLRHDGTGKGDSIKNEEKIDGSLSDMMQRLDDILTANIQTAIDITSDTKEQRYPDYPLVALQQITRNAVMHRSYIGTNMPVSIRWYNNRVEVMSPGGLYGQVTKETMEDTNDYRNPHLATAMKSMGYVQQFGVGIRIAQDALKANGNKELKFDITREFCQVTLYSK